MNAYQPINVDFECLSGVVLDYGKPAQRALGLDNPVDDLYVIENHSEIVTMIDHLSKSQYTVTRDADIEKFITAENGSQAQKDYLESAYQHSLTKLETAFKTRYKAFEAQIEPLLPKGTTLNPQYEVGINPEKHCLFINGVEFFYKFEIVHKNIPEEIRELTTKFLKVIEYHGSFTFALDGYCNFIEEEVFFDVSPEMVDRLISTVEGSGNAYSLTQSDFPESIRPVLDEYMEEMGYGELEECIDEITSYAKLLVSRRTLNDVTIAPHETPYSQIEKTIQLFEQNQEVLSKYPKYNTLMMTVLEHLKAISDNDIRLFDAVDMDNSGDADLCTAFFVDLGICESEELSVQNAYRHLMETGEDSETALHCNDETLLPFLLKFSYVMASLIALEAFTNP